MTTGAPSSSPRSHRGRRAGVTALVAGALVAGSAVVATSVAGPASAANSFTDLVTIQTGATTNAVVYYPSDDETAVTTQNLTSSACKLSSDSSVITFGPDKVGLRQGSIGIINGGAGESCGQVNAPSEVLTLDLGRRIASTAVLDMELQKNAVVLATLTRGTTKTYVELQSGSSITNTRTPAAAGGFPVAANVPVTVATCQLANSSANNSGPSDNCRWVIDDAKFTSISLKTIIGNASLEGGADGTVTRLSSGDTEPLPAARAFSYFITEDLFQCQTGAVTVEGLGSNPDVTIRDVDVSSTPACQDFEYELTTGIVDGAATATFTKPWSDQSTRLEFMMDLAWDIPAPAPTTATATGNFAELPKVQFGFHSKTLVKGTAYNLPWCTNPVFNSNGLVDDLATTPTEAMEAAYFPMYNLNANYPGVQYACMAESKLVRDETTGQPIEWFQSIYVHGDAFARRP